jgi:superfamily I DNA and/or RNA helicase
MVCLYVLTRGKLSKWSDIPQALNSLAAPASIREVLNDALRPIAAERPEDAQVLLERLNRAARDAKPAALRDTCYLSLTDTALASLRQQVLGLESRREAESFIENDFLRGSSWLRRRIFDPETRKTSISPDQYTIIGETLKLAVAVDRMNPTNFAIISSLRPSSDGYLEKERSQGWAVELNFKVGRPSTPQQALQVVESLISGVEYHEQQSDARGLQDEEERLFRNWSDLLQIRMDHCREDKSYNYRGCEPDGNRITFNLSEAPDKSILEETWMVEGTYLSGVVDAVSDDSITLYIDEADAKNPPKDGRLVVDRRATQKQLKIQLEALNFMRQPRNERQEILKRRILHPSDAQQDTSCEPIKEWFSEPLDDNKKQVIQAALASRDIFLAEGPPGTGKTTFIAELILQFLARSPQKRILLTSQTHIAVDNAIERVAKHRPDLRITRVGRRESKVADSVHRYLLQNRLDEWRKRVYQQATEFLKHRAQREGLNVKEIQMGLDAGLLVKAQQDLRLAEESERERQTELDEIGRLLAEKDTDQNLTLDASRAMFLDQEKERLEDDLGMLRKTLKERASLLRQFRASFKKAYPDYSDLAEKPIEEIIEWQDSLVGSSPAANRFRALFELNAEWIQRFALREDCEEAILMDSDLIAGTCIGIAGSDAEGESYGLCILDEASKASFPEALVPLIRSEKWVLVGDQRQLPPFVDAALRDNQIIEAREIDTTLVRETLLSRLSNRGIPDHARAMLYRQHRMVPAIGGLVSTVFYEGRLESVGGKTVPLSITQWQPKAVVWHSTSKQVDRSEQKALNGSWMNPLEAKWTRLLLDRLDFYATAHASKVDPEKKIPLKVVVLTGYSAQRNHLENALGGEARPNLEVDFHTVDAYQGREADVVVFSVTRSNREGKAGFLSERERINVALSRARYALCIVGDADFCRDLGGQSALAEVREYMENHGDDCQLKEGIQ